MADHDLTSEPDLPAGAFASWVSDMRGALRGDHGSDVPCGACTACCRSSQFVHIGPHETDTLAHIPAELLFPAPRLPRGHVVLGYDERGHCPMLVDNRCSIYEHRPNTCRTYDCRIFPAAGIDVEAADKPLIAEQAGRWRFSHPTTADRNRHDAVQAAAVFLRRHPDALPEGAGAGNATQLAVLAIEVHDAFLDPDERPDLAIVDPELVRAMLAPGRRGGAGVDDRDDAG